MHTCIPSVHPSRTYNRSTRAKKSLKRTLAAEAAEAAAVAPESRVALMSHKSCRKVLDQAH